MQIAEKPAVESQDSLLHLLARRYIWWQDPDEAREHPNRVLAQAMSFGDYDDVVQMVDTFGEDRLREVVQNAEAGWFDARSWAFWNYALKIAHLDDLPPLPVRRF